MSFWLHFAAYMEITYEWLQQRWLLFTRRLLLPALVYRGRDMFLLRNGLWVDAAVSIHDEQIIWRYDSITHRLTHGPGPLQRWPWIAAVSGCGRDMSDFFADLRITRGPRLTDAKIVELFIHQKGWVPSRDIRITRRDDATEETLYVNIHSAITDVAPSSSRSENDLNYIR
jgi:hypothetical protein